MDIFVGQRSSYRKIKTLGEGSYGEVYLVEDLVTHEPFALKKFFPAPDDPSYNIEKSLGNLLKKFDVRSNQSVCFPFVVCMHDFNSVSANNFFVVYELMEGDLFKFVPRSLEEVVQIMYDTLMGMTWIHRHKLAHNDLKPANILYRFDRQRGSNIFKIGDLGSACTSTASHYGYPRFPCSYFGTPMYAAPEVNTHFKTETNYAVLQKSDMWSLGVIYFTLLGRLMGIEDWREILPYNYTLYEKEMEKVFNYFENTRKLESYQRELEKGPPFKERVKLERKINEVLEEFDVKPLQQSEIYVLNGENMTREAKLVADIINSLLRVNPNERPDAERLAKLLEPYVR